MIFTLLFLIAFYSFVAGGVGKQMHQLGAHKCSQKVHDWEHCGHYYTGIIGGLFWPVALPIAAGMKSSDTVPTPISKELKADKKRDEEIKNKKHAAEIEMIELQHQEMLNRQLELTVKRGENELRLLELESAGVKIEKDI